MNPRRVPWSLCLVGLVSVLLLAAAWYHHQSVQSLAVANMLLERDLERLAQEHRELESAIRDSHQNSFETWSITKTNLSLEIKKLREEVEALNRRMSDAP